MLNQQDTKGLTALSSAIMCKNNAAMLKLLIIAYEKHELLSRTVVDILNIRLTYATQILPLLSSTQLVGIKQITKNTPAHLLEFLQRLISIQCLEHKPR